MNLPAFRPDYTYARRGRESRTICSFELFCWRDASEEGRKLQIYFLALCDELLCPRDLGVNVHLTLHRCEETLVRDLKVLTVLLDAEESAAEQMSSN